MTTRGVDLAPLITPHIPGTVICALPMYRSCLAGEEDKIPLQSSPVTSNPAHTHVIKKGGLRPGDYIITD